MITIPQKTNKSYNVSSEGDLFGNVVNTRNMDFTKKGFASLARKAMALYTEAQDADFETPIFITSDESLVYICTSGEFFTVSPDGDLNFQKKNTSPPSVGFQSDYAFFTADIHVSGSTHVYSLNGSTWTSRITGLSSSYPHPMCVSEHQSYLAVGNGNTVRLYNSSYTLVTTCTIPSSQVVTWIRWRGNLLYFGTRNITGGLGKMYIWNGSGTAANAAYSVGTTHAFTGFEYENTMAVITSNGRFLLFTGSGFSALRDDAGREVAFPVYFTDYVWGLTGATSNLLSKVANRGAVVDGRKIYIVVDSSIEKADGDAITPNSMPNFPSGLWCFDPAIGLYHMSGVDTIQVKKATMSAVAVSNNTITLSSAVVYETGDAVLFDDTFSAPDLENGAVYYAIKVDSTHIKLALTAKLAQAGTPITLSAWTPSGTGYIMFNSQKQIGATEVERGGCVHILSESIFPRYMGNKIIFGCDTRNNTNTSVGTVMTLGMGKNIGSYTTPRIQADNFTDVVRKLCSKFKEINYTSRKILIKYKTSKTNRWGVPGRGSRDGGPNAVWATSTTFTIDPTNVDVSTLQEGDEIYFLKGACAGYTAHVTDITVNSSTSWTITIDETMPDVTASDETYFTYFDWIKYATISNTDDAQSAQTGLFKKSIAKNAKWFQIKIELRGYCDRDDSHDMEELALITGADQNYG